MIARGDGLYYGLDSMTAHVVTRARLTVGSLFAWIGWFDLGFERSGYRGSQFCTGDDSYRYRQLGHAVTGPVAAWIARRILHADK